MIPASVYHKEPVDRQIKHQILHLDITSQNASLNEPFFMSSKHIRISSFAENHVSRPYLAEIVCRSNNQR
jgi:hypothetical protein